MGRRTSSRWLEHTVSSAEAGRSVEEILRGSMRVSRRMLQRLTRSRGIRLNRRPAFLGREVREGDVVAARIARPEEAALEPVSMELAVVFEDADLVVVDKPPSLLVHPTRSAQTATLAHGVAHHLEQQGIQARVRPVHRLDRDTSGLVLFAKTSFAHQHLDRQLREGKLRRRYLALAAGEMEADQGVIAAPIGRHPRHPHLRVVRADGSPARTLYRVLQRLRGATLLELELETGRTHQIRVHLAHADHPVLGDRQYGRARVGRLGRQALHASQLAFDHPLSGQRVELSVPLPPDLQAAMETMQGGE